MFIQGIKRTESVRKIRLINVQKGSYAKTLSLLRKELKNKMKLLENEYKKKWVLKGSKVSVGTKIWDGAKYASKTTKYKSWSSKNKKTDW